MPPSRPTDRKAIREISEQATKAGRLSADSRRRLDTAVFRLFDLTAEQAEHIHAFLMERAPAALRTYDFLT
jgi:hypothetical protein